MLYPRRAELADALLRLKRASISLDGASDHGVSEALYLRDPDENGLELLAAVRRACLPHVSKLAIQNGPLLRALSH